MTIYIADISDEPCAQTFARAFVDRVCVFIIQTPVRQHKTGFEPYDLDRHRILLDRWMSSNWPRTPVHRRECPGFVGRRYRD